MKMYDVSYYTSYYTCYTPLHRKLGILTRWQVKYLNQEIEQFNSKHPLRGHAAVMDPSNDIQANLVFSHFFEKIAKCEFLLIITHCYTLLHCTDIFSRSRVPTKRNTSG